LSQASIDASTFSKEPAFYKRRKKRGNEIGQILLRLGRIKGNDLREALRFQAESGGLLGNVLRRMGACDGRDVAEALIEQARIASEQGKNDFADQARQNPSLAGLSVRFRPQAVALLLMAADCCAVLLGAAVVWLLTAQEALTVAERVGVLALVPLSLAAFSAAGLYALSAPSPPQEIRSVTLACALVFFALWTTAALTHAGYLTLATHLSWAVGLLATIAFVPLARAFVRSRFARRPWWGQPVVVFGAGKMGRSVVSALQSRPELGLRPVAILSEDETKLGTLRMAWSGEDIDVLPVNGRPSDVGALAMLGPGARSAIEQFSEVDGVPVMGGFELAPVLAQRLGIRSAVIAAPLANAATVHGVIERYANAYTNLLVVPDLFDLAHFGAPTRYMGGILGIEVQRQLLLRWPRFTKRSLDLTLTGLGLLIVSPLFALIALLIKLDSRGPVFYTQKRLGQDGVRFNAYKFRTMHGDGEQRLQQVLASDPALRAEYDQFHKLSRDPRVTRVGKLLRRYSLDELPQLLNVLFGDMSLVGPRPYLERELAAMEGRELIVLCVKPGITGYWQVTERNATTFDHRVRLDVEYVRSWSPWLDLYVIARTVPVVLGGTGS
jgi:lipopolysaccharide/colanic/teichoic acid biosynthesis glycosyltransferase